MATSLREKFANLPITRDRDLFLRELLRELAGALEDVVGAEQASGFISIVGYRLGKIMDAEYRAALGEERLDLPHAAHALIDLKSRIDGGFAIESLDEERVVLVNTRCPFGAHVSGRPSLCMMTSNVFGKIVAENQGYARVELVGTIARGDPGCRVVIHLNPESRAAGSDDREYFSERD